MSERVIVAALFAGAIVLSFAVIFSWNVSLKTPADCQAFCKPTPVRSYVETCWSNACVCADPKSP